MKKLFLFGLLFLLSLKQIAAQKNSVSISAGPGSVYYLTDEVVESGNKTPVGYAVGMDYTRKVSYQWQFKLGIRYCSWQIPVLAGPVQWPSEQDSNGVYQRDPSLAHYIITDYTKQGAIQFLPGFRWQSSNDLFHWIGSLDIGITSFLKNEAGIQTKLNLTTGFSMGGEWSFSPKWHVFLQPGGRLILREYKDVTVRESPLLHLQLDMGARYTF